MMLFDFLIKGLDKVLVCHKLESIFHALDKVWVEFTRVVVIKYVKDSTYH
jgi:hypothetical protein